MRKIIAPSILSCDFSNLASEIKRTDKTDAEYIHIDVMDGCFVPNLTIGPAVISSIRKYTKKTFDVHLMIQEPIRSIEEYRKAGADLITVHVEACKDVKNTLIKIKECGAKAGLSIKPKTDPFVILPFLELCDMVLVMTVEPGFGGQSFIPETVENIKKVKQYTDRLKTRIPIEVDGGITKQNIGIASVSGADIFVAGSAVYREKNIAQAVRDLLDAANAAE